MADSSIEPAARPAEPAAPFTGPASPGRVLALTYGFFTLAAGARSGVQLATKASEAPVAYGLSAMAAVIYLLGMLAVIRADAVHPDSAGGRRRWSQAFVLCCTELAGVLIVGLASLIVPQAFPDATVWSGFGSGYGWVPLALPLAGLLWLRHRRPSAPGRT